MHINLRNLYFVCYWSASSHTTVSFSRSYFRIPNVWTISQRFAIEEQAIELFPHSHVCHKSDSEIHVDLRRKNTVVNWKKCVNKPAMCDTSFLRTGTSNGQHTVLCCAVQLVCAAQSITMLCSCRCTCVSVQNVTMYSRTRL